MEQQICLNFKIKTQDNCVQTNIIADSVIRKQQIEITGSFIVQEDKYWQVFIEIKNKTKHFPYNFPKNTEIARLYFLILIYHTEKQSRLYTSKKSNSEIQYIKYRVFNSTRCKKTLAK